jgi:hypothetical protein
MSADPPQAALEADVAVLPLCANSRPELLQQTKQARLLDHLIDTHEKGHRHFKSEHLGGA